MTRMLMLARATVALGFTLPMLAAQAASCSATSSAHTVALVELYTSEGCSSCPPADRWLTELAYRYPPDRLLPLSLHVDYWDYIGWQDPYAQARFSERQRELGRLASTATIYTPEVFVGMKELRGWRDADGFENRVQSINRQPARARISVHMRSTGSADVDLSARFDLDETARSGRMTQGIVLVFEKQLSSEVSAGENRGAKLRHDNVVRYWSKPATLDVKTGQTEWRQLVTLPAAWKRENLNIAAFVQDGQAGEVLQAVSMPACF